VRRHHKTVAATATATPTPTPTSCVVDSSDAHDAINQADCLSLLCLCFGPFTFVTGIMVYPFGYRATAALALGLGLAVAVGAAEV
jgi:hypothetical protein